MVQKQQTSIFEKMIVVLFFIVLICYLHIKIYDNNKKACYNNIGQIQIGDKIEESLKKMDKGTFLRKRIIEKKIGYNGADAVVIYPYVDWNDPASSYPEIFYNSQSGKVVWVKTGLVY